MPSIEKLQSGPLAIQETPDAPNDKPRAGGRLSVRALLIESNNNTFVQFVRYMLAGGLALTADFLTLFLLTRYGGIHYLISAALAFSVGLTINYTISSVWVFAHRTVRKRSVEFAIFAAIGLAGLGLNELGMWLLSGVWGIYYLWAKLVTAVLVFAWNFGARKVALFR